MCEIAKIVISFLIILYMIPTLIVIISGISNGDKGGVGYLVVIISPALVWGILTMPAGIEFVVFSALALAIFVTLVGIDYMIEQ